MLQDTFGKTNRFMHAHEQYFRFNLIYYTLITVFLFLFAILFHFGDEVYFINGMHTPWLDGYFAFITNLGDALYFIPVLIAVLFLRFGYAWMMVVTGVAHAVIVSIFKRLLFPAAGRPITMLAAEQLYFVPGVEVYSKMSFPSGHTATAFAFMVLLSLMVKNRWLTFIFSLLALSVGVSRMYLVQHFGMDVAMGSAIGSATAFITYYTIWSGGMRGWMGKRLQYSRIRNLRNLSALRQRFNSRV